MVRDGSNSRRRSVFLRGRLIGDWRGRGEGLRPAAWVVRRVSRRDALTPGETDAMCRRRPQSADVPVTEQPSTVTRVARTIARLWLDAVAAAHPDPAYLHEVDGEWVPVSRAEAARAVDELANGLLALGIRKGDAF